MRSLTLTTLAFLGTMQAAAPASAEEGRLSPASNAPIVSSAGGQTRGAQSDDVAPTTPSAPAAMEFPAPVPTAPLSPPTAAPALVMTSPSVPSASSTLSGLRLSPSQTGDASKKLKNAFDEFEDRHPTESTKTGASPLNQAIAAAHDGANFVDQSTAPARRLTTGAWFDSVGSFRAHIDPYMQPVYFVVVALLSFTAISMIVRGFKREIASRKAAAEREKAGWTYRPFR